MNHVSNRRDGDNKRVFMAYGFTNYSRLKKISIPDLRENIICMNFIELKKCKDSGMGNDESVAFN